MIEERKVRDALELLGPGTRLDISSERTGLLRYARSRVTAQHDEERLRVRVRVTRDGRVAGGTVESLETGAVRALAERLRDALSCLPQGGTAVAVHPAAGQGEPAVPPVAPATVAAGAGERYAWFSTIRDGLGGRADLGGAVRHDVVGRVVADHDGLYRSETLTKASLQAIASRDGRSAGARIVHRDAARISVDGIAERLLGDLAPLPTGDPLSGTCRVLLRPQAVITLLTTYAYAALGAAGYAQGRTAAAGRMGERIVSELLTLTDDAADPAGLPSGFDVEGTCRSRTPLIDRGVLRGVVSDLERAPVTGGRSTGHGVPIGWRFGADPSPSHILLDAGDADEAELMAACGDGQVITRLDYLRVLHPKDTLVTGTTRDATYWLKDGRVAAWAPPVRLTFRMDEVLSAVIGVGRERERGEAVFMESAVAPALLVEAGAFSA
ncbi:MAG: metallopeptidase TldD-related protein [Actinomycetia bacterium]|nr:metallopeptidase TldD-related protein [Actinomycetes bacterium]